MTNRILIVIMFALGLELSTLTASSVSPGFAKV